MGLRGLSQLTMRRTTHRSVSPQPAGDDPARKGIIDSLTCGCIPVLFYHESRQLWPAHWGGWASGASVLLPYEHVLNGSLNVLQALESISPHEIASMQSTIRHHVHAMHYAFRPDGESGDALEVLLDDVWRRAYTLRGAHVPPRKN